MALAYLDMYDVAMQYTFIHSEKEMCVKTKAQHKLDFAKFYSPVYCFAETNEKVTFHLHRDSAAATFYFIVHFAIESRQISSKFKGHSYMFHILAHSVYSDMCVSQDDKGKITTLMFTFHFLPFSMKLHLQMHVTHKIHFIGNIFLGITPSSPIINATLMAMKGTLLRQT